MKNTFSFGPRPNAVDHGTKPTPRQYALRTAPRPPPPLAALIDQSNPSDRIEFSIDAYGAKRSNGSETIDMTSRCRKHSRRKGMDGVMDHVRLDATKKSPIPPGRNCQLFPKMRNLAIKAKEEDNNEETDSVQIVKVVVDLTDAP